MRHSCFFFNDTATTEIYTLSLHDALPILPRGRIIEIFGPESSGKTTLALHVIAEAQKSGGLAAFVDAEHAIDPRSEEHTSELQSRQYLVCRLLLEKKNIKNTYACTNITVT